MDAADYWLMAREYSIWNATIASFQFWSADLDPVTPGRTTEQVYTTFFYSPSSHTLCQQSEEILFGHFVIALNAAFDQQLSLANEGYESGSDPVDLPTPLRKTPRIHHVSSMEHASFNPAPVTPRNTPQTPPRSVCRCLSFSSADNNTPASTPECSKDEEDFQTVPLDNEHWISEEIPERLCIHEHGITTWVMPIPMPLCKLSDAFLHGQLGFKWHFGLWGLYGHIQWWRHTSIRGYTLLRDALAWFEHYIIYSTSSIINYIECLTMSNWTFFCWTPKKLP